MALIFFRIVRDRYFTANSGEVPKSSRTRSGKIRHFPAPR
jgi:hypothetical protein